MKLVGSGEQTLQHFLLNFDGVTVSGAKLVVPRSPSRSHFIFVNLSSSVTMYLGIGWGGGTATISNGAVTGVTAANVGFGYLKPPRVYLHGGGAPQGFAGLFPPGGGSADSSYAGLAHPGAPAPQHPATAIATISGGAISGITVNDPGAGYLVAPYVQIIASDLDPVGCELPSATYGIPVAPGGSLYYNGTATPTDPISVYCGTASVNYTCRIMT